MRRKSFFIIAFICIICLTISTGLIVSAVSDLSNNSNFSIQEIATLEKNSLSYEGVVYNGRENNEKVNKYTDLQNNEFFYDVNGEMVGFILETPINTLKQANTSALTTKNIDTIKTAFKSLIDLKDYALEEKVYDEILHIHYLTFYRYINGYKSSDFVAISLDDRGNILSYAAPNVITSKNLSIPNIDTKKIEEQLTSTLNSKLGKNQYRYELKDSLIDINDGELTYIMFVEIETITGIKTADIYQFDI